MKKITLVLLCAGNSTRFSHKTKKQWLRIGDTPLWLFVANRFKQYYDFENIIIVSHKDEIEYMKNFSDDFIYVQGGETRQNSLKNSLEFVDTKYVMVSDVARSCIPKNVIDELIKNIKKADCIVPTLDVSDTVIYNNETIKRENVKLIQTPQLSKTKILKKALNNPVEFTDDSSAIKANNGTVHYTKGSLESKKLTIGDELNDISCLKKPKSNSFCGQGYDVHQFQNNKKMFLGGVHIPCEYGFKAHSDGDILIHSLIDALLGAIAAGDIGEFFPDTDPKYKGADSKLLLKHICNFIQSVGYEIINIDLTIVAQQPKINPYKNEIKSSLSKLLKLEKQFINIKATTSEKMGFIGRAQGVAVHSIANLKYYDWTKNEDISY